MKQLLLAAALIASPALSQDNLRALCSDRPGLNTAPCTVDAGHLQVEFGAGDWIRDKSADSRTDTVLAGELLTRYGLGETTEWRLGWTAYGHVRERDRLSGDIVRRSGVGDMSVGLKQSLAHPDGSGFALALLPYATLPTGTHSVGAGDWGAGLLIPVTYELNDTLTLEATPEVDAAVDEDRHGRHSAYGSAAGLLVKLSDKLSLSGEVQATRDRDPSGHGTQALAGIFVAYQPEHRLQLDAGVQGGLNHNTSDIDVSVGLTRKF